MVGSCRKVLNKTPAMTAPTGFNGRTCLADAICALLPDDQSKQSVFSSICSEMPAKGGTSIRCANVALARHGMVLERATSQRRPTLSPDERVGVQNITRMTVFASHFVVWDGKIVWG